MAGGLYLRSLRFAVADDKAGGACLLPVTACKDVPTYSQSLRAAYGAWML